MAKVKTKKSKTKKPSTIALAVKKARIKIKEKNKKSKAKEERRIEKSNKAFIRTNEFKIKSRIKMKNGLATSLTKRLAEILSFKSTDLQMTRDYIEKHDLHPTSNVMDCLVHRLLHSAIVKGDMNAMAMVYNRIDGATIQRTKVDVNANIRSSQQIVEMKHLHLSIDDRKNLLAAVRAGKVDMAKLAPEEIEAELPLPLGNVEEEEEAS